MASSTHHLTNFHGGATAAPPPTPSTQPNPFSTSEAADALSRLFHRLPPALSLPTRRSQAPTMTNISVISLSEDEHARKLSDDMLSAATETGVFQLVEHGMSPELANKAEVEALSLFDLTKEEKESLLPKNWPLGFNGDDDDDDEEEEEGCKATESFCVDASCCTESTELKLASLREFIVEMEKLGLKIVELLLNAVGSDSPFKEDPARACSLMWISEGLHGNKPVVSGGLYPFIVGLQYQIRVQKYSLLNDSGWVSVSPQVDSVMVTVGDIAHVWSNGKLKKVGGRPVVCSGSGNNNSRCISMCLLVTLPIDSDMSISPLLPSDQNNDDDDDNEEKLKDTDEKEDEGKEKKEERLFKTFSFDEYAWRVYHERLHFKDPLQRYRI